MKKIWTPKKLLLHVSWGKTCNETHTIPNDAARKAFVNSLRSDGQAPDQIAYFAHDDAGNFRHIFTSYKK
jgi:hypothetical protein